MKKYLKMNHNNTQLSLGNTCLIIKNLSKNKTLATQTDIFCAIFNIESANDSTVNNYCVGCRPIGGEYKKIYQEIKQNQKSFNPILKNIFHILEGNYEDISTNTLNNKDSIKLLAKKLYNLAKNDRSILPTFINQLRISIEKEDYVNSIKQIITYIVLEKKQPIYIENIVNDTIENILSNTNISLNDLEKFLTIQFNDGLNYNYSLKKLAEENNPYASFELGLMEYKGEFSGTPNYEKSYSYLKIAADANHPRAAYLIAKMLLTGNIGTKSNQDIELAFKYLKKAENLGNIAALNQLGLYYKNIKNDKETAIKYFQMAASKNYPYAYNNLGMIFEKEKNDNKAFKYYLKSAELEESWACNKVGEFYRLGIHCQKDLKKAFNYYKTALNVPKYLQNNYAKYNLAKYFYLNGCYEIEVEKNISHALNLLEDASNHNILEATIELLNYYTKLYFQKKENNTLEKINQLLFKIENHPLYNKKQKDQIEITINTLKKEEKINRNLFKD